MVKRCAALILLTLVVGLAAGCGGDEEGDSEAQGPAATRRPRSPSSRRSPTASRRPTA